MFTGCLKPTNTNSLPVLGGIAPSDIRRAVASRTERTPNYGPKAPTQWTCRSGATPENRGRALSHSLSPPTRWRKLLAWRYGENESSPWTPVCILTSVDNLEGTQPVAYTGWPVKIEHDGFSNEQETCDCGIRQTMQHLLVCPMMNTASSTRDLTMANGITIRWAARHWEGTI